MWLSLDSLLSVCFGGYLLFCVVVIVLLCFGMGHMLNVGSILSFDSNVLCVFEVSLV
jgi:hypothetical protein